MKKIFIVLLMIFSLFLFSCKKNDEFNDEVPISERRSYDGTLRDDTFYFVVLTNEESAKNKEYTVSDFAYLKNLYSVESFLKADNFDELVAKKYYYVVLKFKFKNLTYDIDKENNEKMRKDERIKYEYVNKNYDLSESHSNFNVFESNLLINTVFYLTNISKTESSSIIVNDKEIFDSIKYNYNYYESIKYFGNNKEEFLNRYDEEYFINNSLLYLKIETEFINPGIALRSINSNDDYLSINYNN